MADFQVLFDVPDIKLENPLWGTTHIPNRDIDAEHWDKFTKEYMFGSDIYPDPVTNSFRLKDYYTYIEGKANHRYDLVTSTLQQDGSTIPIGCLLRTGDYTSYANDAAGAFGKVNTQPTAPYYDNSHYATLTFVQGNSNQAFTNSLPYLCSTHEWIHKDPFFSVDFYIYGQFIDDFEARIYFGKWGNDAHPFSTGTDTEPSFYISLRPHVQALYRLKDASVGYELIAEGNLLGGNGNFFNKQHTIYVRPVEYKHLYVYANDGEAIKARVDDFSVTENGSTTYYVIPSGPLGFYSSGEAVILGFKKHYYNSGNDLYGSSIYNNKISKSAFSCPFIELKQEDTINNANYDVTGEYRLRPTTSASWLFYGSDNKVLTVTTTKKFRIQIQFQSTDANYTPEISSISIRRKPSHTTVALTQKDQTANILGFSISNDEDMSQRTVDIRVKENAATEFEDYAKRINIPIKIHYLGTDVLIGNTGSSSFDPKKLQSFGSFKGYDLWHRLTTLRFNDVPAYDGMLCTDVYKEILKGAGLNNKIEGTPNAPPNFDIYINNDFRLDRSRKFGDPKWRPKPGSTYAEFLLDIRDNLTHDLMYWVGDTFYIRPNWWAGLDTPPTPKRTFYTDTTVARAANSYFTVQNFQSEVDDREFANHVIVVGVDDDKSLIQKELIDYDSLNNTSAPNYVGEDRPIYYLNSRLAIAETVNYVATRAYEYHRNLKIVGKWDSAWDEMLNVNDVVEIQYNDVTSMLATLGGHKLSDNVNMGSSWRITGISVDVSKSTLQRPTGTGLLGKYWKASYVALRVKPVCKTIAFNAANPKAPGDPG